MKYTILIAMFIVLLSACSKDNKPRRGLYWAEFYAVDGNGTPSTKYDSDIKVSNASATSLTINDYTLVKSGTSIKGEIGPTSAFPGATSVTIDAKWKQKNGYYNIIGDFTALIASGNMYGSFKMESY